MLGALLFAACNVVEIEPAEPEEATVTLSARVENEATRTYLDGDKYVCWADGDEVWINGNTYTVSVSGSTATIAGVTAASNYACVYPASAVYSHDGAMVKFTLPQTQTITYDAAGRQVLSLPMAAYGDGESALEFKNLCGLMAVTVSNDDKEADLTPTNIKISTSDGPDWTASLYGTTGSARDLSDGSNIDSSDNGWAILASNIGNSGDRTELNVNISGGPAIAKGNSATYFVTVPVIDDGTKSKIGVEMSGTLGSNTFLFNKKTTSSTKTIGRNQLGTIPISSSLFYEIKTSGTDWNGSGTEADPYQISCVDHWNKMADMALNEELTSDMHFLQVCDIDCSSGIKTAGGKVYWKAPLTPTQYNRPFKGHYDGGGHTLKNVRLAIDYPYILGYGGQKGTTYVLDFGLFPYLVSNAEIRNLSVSYSDIGLMSPSDMTQYIGGIVGECSGKVVLENLSCSGTISMKYTFQTAAAYVGGVVGFYHGGTIDNLSFGGTINVDSECTNLRLGGVAGHVGTFDKISNFSTENGAKIVVDCQSLSYARVGGLIGELGSDFNYEGTFVNRADITVTANKGDVYVAGIAADLSGAGSGTRTVASLSNLGKITAENTDGSCYAGGFFAIFDDDEWEYAFVGCSNSGAVKATASEDAYAGGSIGRMDGYTLTVDKFRNTGKIEAYAGENARAGGLVGVDDDGSSQSILNVYNSENRGEIIAKSSGSSYTAYAGGLVGEHNSDGYSDQHPCFINCCNRGAVRASGDDIYIGGLLGLCYDTDTTIGASFALADLAYGNDNPSNLYYGGISGKVYAHVNNWWKLVTGAMSGATRLTPSYAYPNAGTHYQAAEDAAGLVSNLNGAWNSALDAIKDSKLTGYTPTQITWKVDGDYPALDF